jgi:hypothetical protein
VDSPVAGRNRRMGIECAETAILPVVILQQLAEIFADRRAVAN